MRLLCTNPMYQSVNCKSIAFDLLLPSCDRAAQSVPASPCTKRDLAFQMSV